MGVTPNQGGHAMTTVLTVGNSRGSRSCTASCHEAKSPECDCVCGGKYHGKGTGTVLDEVEADVRAGAFGEVATIATGAYGKRQLAQLMTTNPDRVRFHGGAIDREKRRWAYRQWVAEQAAPAPLQADAAEESG